MAFPPLSALTIAATSKVTRMGLVAEQFLLIDSFSESAQVEEIRRRGKSGGTVYIAEIDPRLEITLTGSVMQRRGLANTEVGTSLSLDICKNYLNPTTATVEDRFGYYPDASAAATRGYGILVLKSAQYSAQSKDGLHQITLNIHHELSAFSTHTFADPDTDGSADLATL